MGTRAAAWILISLGRRASSLIYLPCIDLVLVPPPLFFLSLSLVNTMSSAFVCHGRAPNVAVVLAVAMARSCILTEQAGVTELGGSFVDSD